MVVVDCHSPMGVSNGLLTTNSDEPTPAKPNPPIDIERIEDVKDEDHQTMTMVKTV